METAARGSAVAIAAAFFACRSRRKSSSVRRFFLAGCWRPSASVDVEFFPRRPCLRGRRGLNSTTSPTPSLRLSARWLTLHLNAAVSWTMRPRDWIRPKGIDARRNRWCVGIARRNERAPGLVRHRSLLSRRRNEEAAAIDVMVRSISSMLAWRCSPPSPLRSAACRCPYSPGGACQCCRGSGGLRLPRYVRVIAMTFAVPERELLEAWRAVANAKLVEFRRQSWRLAGLVRQGLVTKQAAADRLWEIATAHALVRSLGADRVQAIIAEVFSGADFDALRCEVA